MRKHFSSPLALRYLEVPLFGFPLFYPNFEDQVNGSILRQNNTAELMNTEFFFLYISSLLKYPLPCFSFFFLLFIIVLLETRRNNFVIHCIQYSSTPKLLPVLKSSRLRGVRERVSLTNILAEMNCFYCCIPLDVTKNDSK